MKLKSLEMKSSSLDSLCDELFAEQEKDPSMDKYPRLNCRDDTSAVWCCLE